MNRFLIGDQNENLRRREYITTPSYGVSLGQTILGREDLA
jgi:hypothetical protein